MGQINFWSPQLVCLQTFVVEPCVAVLACNPQKEQYMTCGKVCARMWDRSHGGGAAFFVQLLGMDSPGTCAEYNAKGTLLAVGDVDGNAFLFSAEVGQNPMSRRQPESRLCGSHCRAVSTVSFSPFGNFVATSSLDGIVSEWDSRTGEISSMTAGHRVHSLAYAPEGATLEGHIVAGSRVGIVMYGLVGSGRARLTASLASSGSRRHNVAAIAASVLKSHDLVESNCQICLEQLTSPVTLTCGHNFCFLCVAKWSGTRGGNNSCPTCRAPLPRECRINVNLTRIVSAMSNA